LANPYRKNPFGMTLTQGGPSLGLLMCAAMMLAQPCGAATVDVDFDAPRRGPVCVGAAKGDQLKFSWGEYHNLHEMPDRASYDDCVFGSANQLAPAAPNPGGVVVDLPSAGTRYFACSKICASNGHKVKVCVSDGAAQECDCPEGRSVGPSSPSPPTFPPIASPAPLPASPQASPQAAGADQAATPAAAAAATTTTASTTAGTVVSAASAQHSLQLWFLLSLAVCTSALSLELLS
jgi:hypothetical protein